MPTSPSHLWACFFCCPGKGPPSEHEADDGDTGRMQPVPEKSMNEASCILETMQDKVLLQQSAPSPDSLEQMYGLQDEEWTRPQTPPPHTPSLVNPDLEVLYEKRIQDLEDELNLVLRRNKELSTKVSELEDTMFPQVERTSWAENQPGHQIKGHLAKSMKEKREQEHRALKAEENLRDLKHQNAVLLKRLHQAGWKSPGHVALHPVAPPLGTIGPMFSVLRNATLKMAPPVPQASTETPGPLQENGTREAGESNNHSPSAMHEVLEKIRSGVPLRPVTPPQKSGITLVATRQPQSADGGARCCLNGILVEERAEAPVMPGELSTLAKPLGSLRVLPSETPEMRICPGNEALAGLCTLEQPENSFAERNSRTSPGSGRSTDDEGSTSSTLPVTSNHSTDNEDQDPATGSFKSISITELVSSVTKRPVHAPEALGMVDLAHDCHSNNDWMGSHRQSDSEDHTHPEIVVGNEACVGESSAADLRMSPKVFQLIVGFSELSSEAVVGNHEQTFSFDLTNCMGRGFPGFLLGTCSEKHTGEILDSGVKDGGRLKAHIDAADTLVMEAVDISVVDDILDLVQGSISNVVVTETLAPNDSTQENLLEMAAKVLGDRIDCNNVSSLDGGLTTQNSGRIGPNICEVSLEPSSDPTFEGSSFPERLEMIPVGLPGHEEDLLEKIGQSVVPLLQGVDDSFPSGPDTISVHYLERDHIATAECFPSDDVPCSDAPELLEDSEYF